MAMREPDWLSIPEALERILSAFAPLEAERVATLDALGRVLAEDVTSPVDQPPWDNSAMDGFAVRAEDVRGASVDSPVTLTVIEEIPAGGFPTRPVGPGQATRIMTGAPVPEGADSVIRIEHTDAWLGQPDADRPGDSGPGPRTAQNSERHPAAASEPSPGLNRLRIFRDSDTNRNIRLRGEDLREGTVVLQAGTLVRPGEVGVLATAGRAEVLVHRRPRVAILSTGDELVDLDNFDEVLAGRRIVNSNTYALSAAVREAGGEPIPLGIARDNVESLRERLLAARDADILVTTAGASVGDHDLVKDVLDELGFELDFWRVRMRPGSPFSFGHLGGQPVFGLAGNPVSALLTFEILVRPALRRMLGRQEVHTCTIQARAADRFPSARRMVHFPRAVLEPDPEGGPPLARLSGPQGSGILTSVSRADALVVVPEGVDVIEPGESVTAIPIASHDDAARDFGIPVGG